MNGVKGCRLVAVNLGSADLATLAARASPWAKATAPRS
jgi:hypothetical protein